MGYYNIQLPDNKKGSVRFGPVKKMKTISAFFRRKKMDPETLAYIVTVDLEEGNQKVFYMMRTQEGDWVNAPMDEELSLIKNAISSHEAKTMAV